MTNATIQSLDNPNKGLKIIAGDYLRTGDVYLATLESPYDAGYLKTVELLAHGIGNGISDPELHCPLHKTCNQILLNVAQNKSDVFDTKTPKNIEHLFHFTWDDIIQFNIPDGLAGLSGRALDFIQSSENFFGIRTRCSDLEKSKDDIMNPDTIAWLSGPDNDDLASQFGKRAYKKRHKHFGHLYELAQERKMANPIFPSMEY